MGKQLIPVLLLMINVCALSLGKAMHSPQMSNMLKQPALETGNGQFISSLFSGQQTTHYN